MDDTDFYDRNAEEFCARMLDLDVGHLYEPFLDLLPPGAHILDAGCGPGRDTRAFLARGYRVTALDASREMAARCGRLTGQSVLHQRFQELDFAEAFDGIWACASLLHVPDAEAGEVFRRMRRALRPGGVWYMSFKVGEGERRDGDRLFNDYTEERLSRTLRESAQVTPLRMWRTPSVQPGRADVLWLNALVRRVLPA
jgi:SAM-dependent methyltransferase